MRWLLLKDLQILRRSPLLVALLLALPRLVGRAAVGFALSSGADASRKVAFLNEMPTAASRCPARRRRRSTPRSTPTSCSTRSTRSASRRAPRRSTRSRRGDAIGGADHPARPHATAAVGRSASPARRRRRRSRSSTTSENPLKTQAVESTHQVARRRRQQRASAASSRRSRPATSGILLHGGTFSLLGPDVLVLGLERTRDDHRADARDACRTTRPSAPTSSGSRTSRSWRSTTSTSASRCSRRSASRCTSSARSSTGKRRPPTRSTSRSRSRSRSCSSALLLGGRDARARARGARVRPPGARARSRAGSCSPRRSLLGGARGARRDARGCSAVIALFDDLRWGAHRRAGSLALAGGGAGVRARWASRSARSRATCAPRRCWRSWSRCRSRSSRSSPAAGRRLGSTTWCAISSAIFPFKPALDAINAGAQQRRPGPGQARSPTSRLLPSPYTAIGARRAAEVRDEHQRPTRPPAGGQHGHPPAGVRRPSGARRGADPQPRVPDRVGAARATSRSSRRRARRASSRSTMRAWRTATGFPFAILDADEGDRLIGRVALANVVRGVWQNATLGYWVERGRRQPRSRDRRGAASRCDSRSMSRACTASSRRSCPATSASSAGRREVRLSPRGRARALPADQRRLGGPRLSTR